MNESSIYSIDIKVVDDDIAQIDSNISKANQVILNAQSYITQQEIEKERLYNFKVYITEKSPKRKEPPPKLKGDLFGGFASPVRIIKRGKDFGENTKFIRDFIKDKKTATTKEIMKAYSEYTGEAIEMISKNVSRTLNRLKATGEINNIIKKEGGVRGGRDWKYIKEDALVNN
jgi:hypothetical protein